MKHLLLACALVTLMITGRPVNAQEITLSLMGGDQRVELSQADLDAMPQESFSTTTTWTEGTVLFSGVSLSHLVEDAGLSGSVLRMVALNDYAVEMPVTEIGPTYPIVATRMNGEAMKVRDKGPFWIVYPYDSDPQFQTETIYARSIWQLKTLSVIK